jgi:hypothetical protein
VLAWNKYIRVRNMRNLPPDILVHLSPELPDKRLRLGIGRPVVATVLILADNLTLVTPAALIDIYNKNLHVDIPPSTQAPYFRP